MLYTKNEQLYKYNEFLKGFSQKITLFFHDVSWKNTSFFKNTVSHTYRKNKDIYTFITIFSYICQVNLFAKHLLLWYNTCVGCRKRFLNWSLTKMLLSETELTHNPVRPPPTKPKIQTKNYEIFLECGFTKFSKKKILWNRIPYKKQK